MNSCSGRNRNAKKEIKKETDGRIRGTDTTSNNNTRKSLRRHNNSTEY
jgi:hypothetical protein